MGQANESAKVPAPLQGSIFRIATSTTTNTVTVPAGLAGRHVTFQALTARVEIAFSSGTASNLTAGQVSTSAGDPDGLTAVTTTGWSIPAGEARSYVLPSNVSTFEVIAAAAGTLEFYRSDYEG